MINFSLKSYSVVNMTKQTQFNRNVLNDIRPFVVSNLTDYNLSHEQVDELVCSSYKSFLQNKYSISKSDLKLRYNKGFIENFNEFYKDFLFLAIAAIVDSMINNVPRESFNMILAYDNVLKPSGCNSATFSDNNEEAKALRERLRQKWTIK